MHNFGTPGIVRTRIFALSSLNAEVNEIKPDMFVPTCLVWTYHQDKWWVAPACRSNPGDCTPCTSAEVGLSDLPLNMCIAWLGNMMTTVEMGEL